jgi:hypothetical protein
MTTLAIGVSGSTSSSSGRREMPESQHTEYSPEQIQGFFETLGLGTEKERARLIEDLQRYCGPGRPAPRNAIGLSSTSKPDRT